MQARFVRLEWENAARTIGTAFFKPDRPFYFTAGQYTDLRVPHDPFDNRGLTRTMTITSEPSDKLVGITTRFSDLPRSSYKQALLGLQPNTAVSLSDAMGDMVLPLNANVPLIFVAGGVGIASYASMLRYLIGRKDKRLVTLLYTVRDTRDVIFQELVDSYMSIGSLQKTLFTTDHKADQLSWTGTIKKARLTAADIMKAAADDAQIYLSGSQTMVEHLRHELEDTYKVPQYRLVFDYFDGYVET